MALLRYCFFKRIPGKLQFGFTNACLFEDGKKCAFWDIFVSMYRNNNCFVIRWIVINEMTAVGSFKIVAF